MFTSSDGVPPELAVLGFQRNPACTGQTGRQHRSDRPAQDFGGVDHFDDRLHVLAHSSVLAGLCVNRNINDTLVYSQVKCCSCIPCACGFIHGKKRAKHLAEFWTEIGRLPAS